MDTNQSDKALLLAAGEIYSWEVKNEDISHNGKTGDKRNGSGKR